MVAPGSRSQVVDLLQRHDLEPEVIIEDVQRKIEKDEKRSRRLKFGKVLRDFPSGSYYNFRQYQSYETMRRYMRSVEFAHPNIARVFTIGHSHEGRPIEIMKIGYPVTDETKRIVWVDGGMHAREWAAQHVVAFFIHELVTNYNRDPRITNFLNKLTFFIAPNVNPDGYEYSRSSTHPVVRLWRKNRSPSICLHQNLCCSGTDLNRNFDIEWGKIGTSLHPCSGIFGGKSPFSEPEAQAVRDVVWPRRHQVDAFLTFHTYAQMWTHAYGYVKGRYPPDVDDLGRVGRHAADALRQLYGTRYLVGSSADLLYPSSGGSDDWAKEKAGIKYVYLIELRPDVSQRDGFILPEDQLLPTARETFEGSKAVFDEVLARNSLFLSNAKIPNVPEVCDDVPNPFASQWTCRQQRGWGWCGSAFMRGHCRRSCGECSGGFVDRCDDRPPLGPYSCAQYKQWKMCSQSFMFGFCEITCGTCQTLRSFQARSPINRAPLVFPSGFNNK